MLSLFADSVLKATLLLLGAGLLTLVLRRSSAAARHLVWALGLTGLLVLPLATALVPDWPLAAWPRFSPRAALQLTEPPAEDAAPIAAQARRSDLAALPERPAAAAAPAPAPSRPTAGVADVSLRYQAPFDWTLLVAPVWLGGVLLVGIAIVIGLARVAWIARYAQPVRDAAWLRLTAALARAVGVERPVRLLMSTGPAMPMTWGARRPVILLPADADSWAPERRRDVLLHELAHIKRGDFVTQLVARAACAVYWFHPLAWMAADRLRLERERACDDQVLRAGARPSDYAAHLLEIARSLRAVYATSLASVAMARPSQLAGRLLDVLDASRVREPLPRRIAVPAWGAALAVLVPLAAVAPRTERVDGPIALTVAVDTPPPASGSGGSGSGTGIGRGKSSSTATVTISDTPGEDAANDSLTGCSPTGRGKNRSSTHSVDDGVMINTVVGRCDVHLIAEGRFTFNEDFTDIGTVSSGGQVDVEVNYGDRVRRLTVRPGERIYKVDGRAVPFDAEAKAWLAETLTFLLRRTGWAAEERAKWILEKRGVTALMDEIAQLNSDYARRMYYQAALASGRMDIAAYERLVTQAGKEISSDYELAELLIAVTEAQPLTAAMQEAFVAASTTIASDYERRRVLEAALTRRGLTAGVAVAMLKAAADINSDYELAELLVDINHARPIDDTVRAAFFAAANSIGSDYEHHRVLSAVAQRPGSSRAMVLGLLESAQSIASDYELAELLIDVAGDVPMDDAIRTAFFAAAGTIESDYERGRVLKNVVGRGDVTKPVALAVLETAKGMDSDYELAELLVTVARVVRIDDALRPAYLEAARSISSGYERDRVRAALGRSSGRAQLE